MFKGFIVFIIISLLFYNNVLSQDCRILPEHPLGMTDKYNGIKDNQIKASTRFSLDTDAIYARLHYSDGFLWDSSLPGAGAWSAKDMDTNQYIQVDLLERKVITAISVQGRQGSNEFVKDYYVEYSDGNTPDLWKLFRDSYGLPYLFEGNSNDNTVSTTNITYPIVARHIRIKPQRWNKMISLRFELFGCLYKPWTAQFDGNSRVVYRLDLPGRAIQTARDFIKFRFKTNTLNGLILYSEGDQFDYITIEMFRTRLRVRINLGAKSSVAPETMDNVLDAGSMLDDNQWHDVEIIRIEKDLNITLDRVKMWRNLTSDFLHLNLNRNISVGGLSNYAGKRGVSIMQNFTGCIEEMVFNGLHIIRDAQRVMNMIANANRSWQDVLYYPEMAPTIWWGEQLTESQLGLTNFDTIGAVGTSCSPPASFQNVITFPSIDSTVIFGKVQLEGLEAISFRVTFRTFSRDGMLFYHTIDFTHMKYISLSIDRLNGYLEVDVVLEGVQQISYKIPNPDVTADNLAFSDGMWHTVELSLTKNKLVVIADSVPYETNQLFSKPVNLGKDFYIGGGRPAVNSFQGCMRNIFINNVAYNYDPKIFDPSISNGTCSIIDMCIPNPCKHEAPCTQNGKTFFCDCSLTGYSGEVCHQSQHPTSCSEISLRFAGMQTRRRTIIDLDGSGVLTPFEVECDYSVYNVSTTILHHNNEKEILVEGYSEPGSFRLPLVYNNANRDALNELVRRSTYCEQSINYKCFNAWLLKLRGGGGSNRYNQGYGWWVGRRGQPLFYWGGGIPGLNKCQCGVQGTCTGASTTCNCDDIGSTKITSLSDSGLLTDKSDLPVTEVRLGDTSSQANGKYSFINVGPLRCSGDSLFDNTITFSKHDSVIYLPRLFAEKEFDMIFLFKTTVLNAVVMQGVSKKNQQFFEVRIREGFTIRVTFNVGYGVEVVEFSNPYRLNDNFWHVVRFERNRKESRLIVDENQPVTHQENPDRQYLTFNFDDDLYLGSSQSFTDGYVGCFSNLIINGVIQNLKAAITSNYGLSMGCNPKCASNPCLNRGECYEMYSGYYCECGLTPYRGFVCGREVGASFIDGSAVKISLDYTGQQIGTLEEYIEIGFKTKDKQGILLQVSSEDEKEYIIIKMNNNGGITIEFDVGFERYELPTDYLVDLSNDQHHTLRAWRSDMGQTWNIQVDDYHIVKQSYSDRLAKNADTRLDKPSHVYVGRNFSMSTSKGFTGCIYRLQFNNIFPLKMVFNDQPLPNVIIQGEGGIRENNCGYEEIMPPLEEIEIKQYPPLPPYNVTSEIPDWQKQGIIVGVVLGVIFLLILILLIFFFRNFTVARGDYDTREAKGAKEMDTADNAIRYGKTGQPDVTGKEWWI